MGLLMMMASQLEVSLNDSATTGSHGKKLLLVDDDQDILRMVKNLLEQEGLTVQCAESGEEALSELRLREKPFSLMITDLNLPGLDGLALARKALELAPDMSVIMITGSIEQGITRMAEEAGIATVLFKPFNPDELLKAVRAETGVPNGRRVASRIL